WVLAAWRLSLKVKIPAGPQMEPHTPALSYYLGLGVVLLVFKLGIVDRVDSPLRTTFDGEHVPTVQYARLARLGTSISWLGYDLLRDSVEPGEALHITLYWGAEQQTSVVYSAFAHLVDEHANLYAQQDNLHPGGAPTTTWRAHEY